MSSKIVSGLSNLGLSLVRMTLSHTRPQIIHKRSDERSVDWNINNYRIVHATAPCFTRTDRRALVWRRRPSAVPPPGPEILSFSNLLAEGCQPPLFLVLLIARRQHSARPQPPGAVLFFAGVQGRVPGRSCWMAVLRAALLRSTPEMCVSYSSAV